MEWRGKMSAPRNLTRRPTATSVRKSAFVPSEMEPVCRGRGAANRVRFPAGVAPEHSQVGIVRDDAANWRVFSGISRISHLCIPALLRTHLASPSLALKTSLLRVTRISSHALTNPNAKLVVDEKDCKLFHCPAHRGDVGSDTHAFITLDASINCIDESEIQNHGISLVRHFYIGTKIKLDPGSELESFDLGSGKMLDNSAFLGLPPSREVKGLEDRSMLRGGKETEVSVGGGEEGPVPPKHLLKITPPSFLVGDRDVDELSTAKIIEKLRNSMASAKLEVSMNRLQKFRKNKRTNARQVPSQVGDWSSCLTKPDQTRDDASREETKMGMKSMFSKHSVS
ncbi:hypothetical protein PR048_031661 [Dryococelus australis]|uniref:Uncharacterized protein n=1 Tax=Dryococelus australis TaxID=614101 RepID=A0ABQ9G9Y2_9NEOP|nr:hypothetical protein PR048_031661 [Dryococelus australis]